MGSGEGAKAVRAGLARLTESTLEDRGAEDLGVECEELLGLVGGLQLQIARRLARFEALGGPAGGRAPSLAAWLGRQGRLWPWEARRLATIARRLPLLGQTVAAFDKDEVRFGDVATIAEGIDTAADTMADDWTPERIAEHAQPVLLEAAVTGTPAQLRKEAAKIALVLDGDGPERRRRQIDRQAFLNLGQSTDGAGWARAEMGATDFAVLEKAVDVFAPRPEPGSPRWQNLPGRRRLQGLITACRIALAAAGEHGHRERGGGPVKIHLIATEATVDPSVPVRKAPPGRTEFSTVLSAAEVRDMMRGPGAEVTRIRLRADGSVADRYTAAGKPLNWGRTKRLFTADQRDVYLALHAGCSAEGCDRPLAWSAIDHVVEWAGGGRTDLVNGAPLCDWHNLEKERRRRRPKDSAGPDP